MPFVRPNTYTTGTAIRADHVRENHEALRKYVNANVEPDDIAAASVEFRHMLRGEYASVTPDYRLSTGNHYSAFLDSDPARQALIGSSLKGAGLFATIWHPVIGKRIWVASEDSIALVGAYLTAYPRKNYVQDASGVSDDAWLFVDGDQQAGTRMRFFSDADSTVTSDANGGGPSRRREATIHALIGGLSRGWHTIEVRINPANDFTQVFARSLHVECLEA